MVIESSLTLNALIEHSPTLLDRPQYGNIVKVILKESCIFYGTLKDVASQGIVTSVVLRMKIGHLRGTKKGRTVLEI